MFLSTSTLSLCILLTAVFEAVKGQGNLAEIGNDAISPPTYIVSIQVLEGLEKTATHTCTGVIVNTTCILTQASCVYLKNSSDLLVRAGVTDLSSSLGSTHNVVGYKIDGTLGDIRYRLAAVFVSPPFVEGPQISVKNITGNSTFNEGDTVLVYGWGKPDPGAYLPTSIIQVLITNILSNQICKLFYPNIDPNTTLCMQAQVGSTSKGDAGGPVVLQETGELVALSVDGTSLSVNVGIPSVGSLLGGPLQFVENNFPVF